MVIYEKEGLHDGEASRSPPLRGAALTEWGKPERPSVRALFFPRSRNKARRSHISDVFDFGASARTSTVQSQFHEVLETDVHESSAPVATCFLMTHMR